MFISKNFKFLSLTNKLQDVLLDYMDQIVKTCAALTVENKACVTEWQDIVKGDVELGGFNINVTQVCLFNKLVILASRKPNWIPIDVSYSKLAASHV